MCLTDYTHRRLSKCYDVAYGARNVEKNFSPSARKINSCACVKSSVASRGKINQALRVICLIAIEKIVCRLPAKKV